MPACNHCSNARSPSWYAARHAGFGATGSRNLTSTATASAIVNGAAIALLPPQVRLQRRQRRDGGAQRRAFKRLQPLQRPVQHRRQDLAHQVAAGDAARHGDPRDLLPGRLVLPDAAGDQVRQRLQRRPELAARLRRLRRPPREPRRVDAQRRLRRRERQHRRPVRARADRRGPRAPAAPSPAVRRRRGRGTGRRCCSSASTGTAPSSAASRRGCPTPAGRPTTS